MQRILILFLVVSFSIIACKPKSNSTESTTTNDSKNSSTSNNSSTSGNSSSNWGSNDKSEFVKACLDEWSSDRAQCECMQQKMESKYPDIANAKKVSESEIKDYKNDCNSSSSNTSSSSSTWTDAEREQFVSTCTSSAASLGDRARPYCECSLEKVEKLYPNSRDVGGLTDAQTEAIAKECLKL